MQDKIDEPYFVSVNNHNMEMGDIILPENFNIHIQLAPLRENEVDASIVATIQSEQPGPLQQTKKQMLPLVLRSKTEILAKDSYQKSNKDYKDAVIINKNQKKFSLEQRMTDTDGF